MEQRLVGLELVWSKPATRLKRALKVTSRGVLNSKTARKPFYAFSKRRNNGDG